MAVPRRPFREALLAARRLHLALGRAQAREVHLAVVHFANSLRDNIIAEFGSIESAQLLAEGRRLVRAEQLAREAAQDLGRELEQSIANRRRLTFNRVLGVWQRAGASAAASVGIEGAAFGAVRLAPVTMLGAFDAVGSPQTWRTLTRRRATAAGREAGTIVRNAMLEGVEPVELGRRLRRYVVGEETFDQLFRDVPTLTGDVAKLDLRDVPAELRGQARNVEYNARRIAVSELSNARHEATVGAMIADPTVEMVRWVTAPDRGVLIPPDECDLLEQADLYGMGEGVYPVDKVPSLLHPFCRCSVEPVPFDETRIGNAKPSPALLARPRWPELDVDEGTVERLRAHALAAARVGNALIAAA